MDLYEMFSIVLLYGLCSSMYSKGSLFFLGGGFTAEMHEDI